MTDYEKEWRKMHNIRRVKKAVISNRWSPNPNTTIS